MRVGGVMKRHQCNLTEVKEESPETTLQRKRVFGRG